MERSVYCILSRGAEETFNIARRLTACLVPGDVLALYGDLGAGKTVFVQGICRGFEVQGYVTSPTFTIVQEYEGKLPVYHIDFYRLSKEDIEYLDLERIFRSEGIALIEWAERGENTLPETHYTIELSYTEPGEDDIRELKITAPPGIQLEKCLK